MQKTQNIIRYRIRNRNRLLRDNFFPWGLLGLLLILLPLLFALLWYAKNEIQHTVQTEIENELASNGLAWVNVDVDGQEVMLTGKGFKQDGDRAIALAKKVKKDAWFSQFSAPSKVAGQFSQPAKAVVESVVTPEPVTIPVEQEEPIVAEQSWGSLTGRLDAGVLTLNGVVGSQAEKAALVDVARAKLDPPRLNEIIDNLEVSQDSLIPASAAIAARASDLIAACDSGQSSSLEGVLSIQCQTKRDRVESIQALANEPIDGAELGSIDVSSADDCNEAFVKILDGKSIRFSLGSSQLKSASTPLLDQVSDIAKSCSGSIRVEGHTDKSGSLESNMVLSDARAKAVVEALVERGVKRERLIPEGFGPTRPRVEGDTRVARALNRRIEFHVSQK